MRLPRFTTRRLMVLVALAATCLCVARLWNRSIEYKRLAAEHATMEATCRDLEASAFSVMEHGEMEVRQRQEYRQMAEKYQRQADYFVTMRQICERAARYPWLPVPPVPPPPK